jgi:hypothetical protein
MAAIASISETVLRFLTLLICATIIKCISYYLYYSHCLLMIRNLVTLRLNSNIIRPQCYKFHEKLLTRFCIAIWIQIR